MITISSHSLTSSSGELSGELTKLCLPAQTSRPEWPWRRPSVGSEASAGRRPCVQASVALRECVALGRYPVAWCGESWPAWFHDDNQTLTAAEGKLCKHSFIKELVSLDFIYKIIWTCTLGTSPALPPGTPIRSHFKANSSVVFSTFTMLNDCCVYLVLQCFLLP